jgi:hypothetical protein
MQENMSYLYLVHKNHSADWWQQPLKWVLVAIPHSCTGSSPHQLFQKEIDQTDSLQTTLVATKEEEKRSPQNCA